MGATSKWLIPMKTKSYMWYKNSFHDQGTPTTNLGLEKRGYVRQKAINVDKDKCTKMGSILWHKKLLLNHNLPQQGRWTMLKGEI